MRGKLLFVFACIMITAACGNTNSEQGINDQQDVNKFQSVNYETPKEQKDRTKEDKTIGERGGYPQSEQRGVGAGDENTSHKNEDQFSNENTRLISKYLAERKDIVQAQVSETDNRIIVAVITPDPNQNGDNSDLVKSIDKEVRRVVPDKDIVVYVDKIHWNRMRNLNSHPRTINREVQEKLDNFFGND
jgi:Sporulation lipoprotein YhcN/YlaJ (Spore_YhcN_YlaJ)